MVMATEKRSGAGTRWRSARGGPAANVPAGRREEIKDSSSQRTVRRRPCARARVAALGRRQIRGGEHPHHPSRWLRVRDSRGFNNAQTVRRELPLKRPAGKNERTSPQRPIITHSRCTVVVLAPPLSYLMHIKCFVKEVVSVVCCLYAKQKTSVHLSYNIRHRA